MSLIFKYVSQQFCTWVVLLCFCSQAQANSLCRPQDSGPLVSKEECMQRVARRITLLNNVKKNYDPHMMRMLKVNIYTVKVLESINHLEDAPEIKKEVLRRATLFGNSLKSEMASIKSEELPEYILGLVGDVVKRGVKIAGDTVPVKPTPAGLALKALLKVAPDAMEFAEKVYKDFPKIELADLGSAEFNEKTKEEFIQIYVDLEEARRNGEFDEIQWGVINESFATFMGQTLEITDEKIQSDPEAFAFLGMSELLDYQNGDMQLIVEKAQGVMMEQTANVSEDLKNHLDKKFQRQLSEVQKIQRQGKSTQAKVNRAVGGIEGLEKGQADLKKGQTQIIDGVNYLTQSEMERKLQSNLAGMNKDELQAYVASEESKLKRSGSVAKECGATVKTSAKDGKLHFTPRGLDSEACLVRYGGLEGAKDLLENRVFEERAQLANDTVNVIGNLGVLFKDPNMQKFASDAGKVVGTILEVKKAVEAFDKMGQAVSLISNMAGLMSGVGTLSAAMSLFGGSEDGQAAVNQQILEQLAKIQESIHSLHEDMIEEFAKTQDMIASLGEEVSFGMIMQTSLLTDALVLQSEQAQKNYKQIMEELEVLPLINENFNTLFKKSTLQGMTSIFNNYQSSLGDKAADLLRESVVAYRDGIQEVLPENMKDFSFSSKTTVETSLLRMEDLMNLTALNKASSKGKYVLLNLLAKINSKMRELPPECDDSLTVNLLFANVINREFSKVLSSDYFDEDQGVWRKQSRFYVESRDVYKRRQRAYLSEALSTIGALEDRARICLGLVVGNPKDQQDGPQIFQSLATYYYKTLREHIVAVRDQIVSSGSHVRKALLSEIQMPGSLTIGPDTVFNGMSGDRRGKINDEFVYKSKDVADLETQAFAHPHFMGHPPSDTIGRCVASPLLQTDIMSLKFPRATIDNIITDPSLRVAMSAGLIVWDWCFEIGSYDASTGIKNIFLKASKGNGDDEVTKGVWALRLPVPVAQRDQLNTAEIRTTSAAYYAFGPKYAPAAAPKNSVVTEVVADCSPSEGPRNKVSQGYYQTFMVGNLEVPGLEDRGSKPVEYGYYSQVNITCESKKSVLPDLWAKATVERSGVWGYTSNLSDGCQIIPGGLYSRCQDKKQANTMVSEDEYQEKMKSFWNSRGPFTLEGAWNTVALVAATPAKAQVESLRKQVQSGLKRFYLTVKFASEACERSALLGKQKCSPIKNSIQLETPPMPLQNLTVAGEMLVRTPLTFFKPKTGMGGEQVLPVEEEMIIRLSQVLSPASVIETAAFFRQGESSEESLSQVALSIVDGNETLYKESALPYLQEHFEFDSDLLVHEEPVKIIRNFVDQLRAI